MHLSVGERLRDGALALLLFGGLILLAWVLTRRKGK